MRSTKADPLGINHNVFIPEIHIFTEGWIDKLVTEAGHFCSNLYTKGISKQNDYHTTFLGEIVGIAETPSELPLKPASS